MWRRDMTVYGYARVSTDEQTLDAQLDQLHRAGAARVFSEKMSGAKVDNRQELKKLLKVLKHGDVVVVTALDRLGRSLKDILSILDVISKDRQAKFKSIREPWADNTTDLGEFLTNILASVAQLERKLILARTGDGRRRAMANGIKFGRKPKLDAFQVKEAIERRANGEVLADIARTYKVSRQTIARL